VAEEIVVTAGLIITEKVMVVKKKDMEIIEIIVLEEAVVEKEDMTMFGVIIARIITEKTDLERVDLAIEKIDLVEADLRAIIMVTEKVIDLVIIDENKETIVSERIDLEIIDLEKIEEAVGMRKEADLGMTEKDLLKKDGIIKERITIDLKKDINFYIF